MSCPRLRLIGVSRLFGASIVMLSMCTKTSFAFGKWLAALIATTLCVVGMMDQASCSTPKLTKISYELSSGDFWPSDIQEVKFNADHDGVLDFHSMFNGLMLSPFGDSFYVWNDTELDKVQGGLGWSDPRITHSIPPLG